VIIYTFHGIVFLFEDFLRCSSRTNVVIIIIEMLCSTKGNAGSKNGLAGASLGDSDKSTLSGYLKGFFLDDLPGFGRVFHPGHGIATLQYCMIQEDILL
jgi:hypothetical protein